MKKSVKFIAIGALAGFVNGLFGAGAGMILVPLLTSWGKLDYRNALATSIAIVLPMSLASACLYVFREGIDFLMLLPYLLGGLIGGVIGGRVFKKIPIVWIRRLFALFIIYGGVRNLL